ncbi:hypothetical protein J7T55_009315, partial [Diaporthe amygdali]|uniref:uncharacterized protein n=1 Tax=Phomopsis amygdali TaxID=1214568 RepID=UPI0022FE0A8A
MQNGSQEPTASNTDAGVSSSSGFQEMPLISAKSTNTDRDEAMLRKDTSEEVEEDLTADINDTEMADTATPSPSKIFVMVWSDERLIPYGDATPMEKPKVEAFMKMMA